jgi:hypothetical protein
MESISGANLELTGIKVFFFGRPFTKRNIWKFSLHRLFVIAVGLFWATTLLNITNAQPKKASAVAGLASASGTVVGVKPFTAAIMWSPSAKFAGIVIQGSL